MIFERERRGKWGERERDTQIHKEFENKSNFNKLPYLLGEIPQCDIKAAITCICDLLQQEKVNQ